VALLRGMPEAEARRWVHSLAASKPVEMFTASKQPASRRQDCLDVP
jgi:hypothetical protein